MRTRFASPSFCAAAADRGWHHYPYLGNGATAAIEMALWDICGKAHGCPVHQFFGGLDTEHECRSTGLSVSPTGSLRRLAAQAAEGVSARASRRSTSRSASNSRTTCALARAIREEVGDDVAVRVDANEAWSVFEAVDALRRFEDVGRRVRRAADRHARHRRAGGPAREVTGSDRGQPVGVAAPSGAAR